MASVISSSLSTMSKSIVCQTCITLDNVFRSIKGLKALLCDEEVRNMLSIIYTQCELLQHEVVFVDLLSSFLRDKPIKHLTCVIICRPTPRNIEDIRQELDKSIFSSYQIKFTSTVSNDMLLMIANADKEEIVNNIEEVNMDVTPLAENVVIIPLEQSVFSAGPRRAIVNPIYYNQWNNMYYMRVVDGLCSLMLTMNRRVVVRYRGGSKIAERISKDIAAKMRFLDMSFPDLRCSGAVLLITDRMDDPCTPLLSQWTYEAMLHELIGIVDGNKVFLEEPLSNNNRVSTTGEGNTSKKEVCILTTKSDSFFNKHRFSDWGTICNEVQELVRQASTRTIPTSFEDLKKFVSDINENKQNSYITNKHASLVYRLLEEVKSRHLVDISTVEQDMFLSDQCSEHSNQVRVLVKSPDTEIEDALRLVILYQLRYENSTNNIISELKNELSSRGCTQEDIALIDQIVNIGGYKNRLHQLYTAKNTLLSRGLLSLSSLSNSPANQGKKNILMSHQPLLKRLVNRIYNGELRDYQYPIAHTPPSVTDLEALTMRAKEIIVFMPGGISYEEARLVYDINSNNVDNVVEGIPVEEVRKGGDGGQMEEGHDFSSSVKHPVTKTVEARVVLASTAMVNSSQFLSSFKQR